MIDQYFRRLGYSGQASSNLSTLRDIHALHVAALPFENLAPFLGQEVSLDSNALVLKMLQGRRGGYCFEQNTLFKLAIEQLGFSVHGVSARIHWMSSPQENPRAHMGLIVTTSEGQFFADVGFGGYLLDMPLQLAPDIVQQSPTSTYRFAKLGELFILQVQINSGWQNVYQFSADPSYPVDYEMANWYTSAHPASRFRSSLIITRLTPDVRLRLVNRKFTRRYTDGRLEELDISTPAMLADLMDEEMGIELPVAASAIFARLQ